MPSAPSRVLVVGAGPTGLFLAHELTRLGVSVRLIEKKEEPSKHSKAFAVQARTLEIFAQSGLSDPLIAQGLKIARAHLAVGTDAPVTVDLSDIESPFAFLLSVPQATTERVLEAALRERGGAVERGVELLTLADTHTHVTALLKDAEGEKKVNFDWVIGCDGAHSVVRERLQIPFEGAELPEAFVLADATFTLPWEEREPFVRLTEHGPLALLPLPGGEWRMIVQVGPEFEAASLSPEDLQALIDDRRQEPIKIGTVSWASHFQVHRRIVEKYVHGRILLAGDAAHLHSPVGGQGMNLGLQDAHNLAWKLALVARRLASRSLLDTYQEERHPLAEETIEATTRATRLLTSTGALGHARDFLFRLAAPLDLVQRKIGRALSQTEVDYDESSITANRDVPWQNLESGDFAGALVIRREGEPCFLNQLLTDHRHLILALREPGKSFRNKFEERHGTLLRLVVHEPDGHVQLPEDGDAQAIIIRPDGYIAAASRNLDLDWIGRFLDTCGMVDISRGTPDTA